MNKQPIILLVSLVIALVPFLGLPLSWETFLIVAFALSIAVLAFLDIARTRTERFNLSRESESFSQESSPRE